MASKRIQKAVVWNIHHARFSFVFGMSGTQRRLEVVQSRVTCAEAERASPVEPTRGDKNRFDFEEVIDLVSEIKPIRTDTTLDLSQKAEKV